MFKSEKKMDKVESKMIDTIIGEKTVIQGTLYTEEVLRLDGTVKGQINSKSTVIVGEHGKVEGDVTAIGILVAGIVNGNLHIQEKTELTASGNVVGDIVTGSLVVEEGASFRGNCSMAVASEPTAQANMEPVD